MSLFNFIRKKEESVIGVDIGASSIKVVQLKKSSGIAVLETYGELSLGSYGNSEIGQATNLSVSVIAEALTDLLREANITAKKAGVSIPFSSSLVSLISMPALDKKQLSTMVPVEARKYIPVPINEVSLDWFVISGGEDDVDISQKEKDKEEDTTSIKKIEVLLVAIHNNTLSKYSEIVQTAGLEARFFEIEVFSAIRSVIDQSIAPVAVIDMGAANTKLYIVEYGIVKMSHMINTGGQNLTQTVSRSLGINITKAEELKRKSGLEGDEIKRDSGEIVNTKDIISLGLGRLFDEANRILLQYQQKHNKNIAKVILTGGGATIKNLLPFAKKKLETEVILSDPFSKVEFPAFFESVLKEVGPDFAVAIGLALRMLQEE